MTSDKLNELLVSICIPTFNGEKYLMEALDSVKHQTYKNLEVIVSDDDSDDKTLDLVKNFKNKANFPVYIHHHNPNGIGANWNNCIKKANGEYIKFLFQDDVLYSECIEEMVKIINKGAQIALVSAKRDILFEGPATHERRIWMDRHGNLQFQLPSNKDGLILLDKSFFKSPLFYKYPYNKVGEPSGTLFRKSLLQEIGFFREDMFQILDVEFYNRILKKHEIAIINKELYAFRIHSLQATNQNKSKEQEELLLYDRILFSDFFWYLNTDLKQYLLDLFRPFQGRIFRKIRNIFEQKIRCEK